MSGVILPNILAMISSFVAIVLLAVVILKVGGSLGVVLKLLSAGIFFAVFAHAGIELASIYGIVAEELLMPVMGALLTAGSILFMIAGLYGLKLFK